jgi:hypothetical protein
LIARREEKQQTRRQNRVSIDSSGPFDVIKPLNLPSGELLSQKVANHSFIPSTDWITAFLSAHYSRAILNVV